MILEILEKMLEKLELLAIEKMKDICLTLEQVVMLLQIIVHEGFMKL
jgi:hypothetical protein